MGLSYDGNTYNFSPFLQEQLYLDEYSLVSSESSWDDEELRCNRPTITESDKVSLGELPGSTIFRKKSAEEKSSNVQISRSKSNTDVFCSKCCTTIQRLQEENSLLKDVLKQKEEETATTRKTLLRLTRAQIWLQTELSRLAGLCNYEETSNCFSGENLSPVVASQSSQSHNDIAALKQQLKKYEEDCSQSIKDAKKYKKQYSRVLYELEIAKDTIKELQDQLFQCSIGKPTCLPSSVILEPLLARPSQTVRSLPCSPLSKAEYPPRLGITPTKYFEYPESQGLRCQYPFHRLFEPETLSNMDVIPRSPTRFLQRRVVLHPTVRRTLSDSTIRSNQNDLH